MSDHQPADQFSLPQPPPPPPTGFTVRTPVAETPVAQQGALGPSPSRGILCGLAAALSGGAVWYGVVVATDRQIAYLAIVLGVFIGAAVSWGSGKAGISVAAISAVIAAASVIASYYYIDRHALIEGGKSFGFDIEIPLLPSFEDLKEVLRIGFEAEGSQYLYSLLCVAAAGFFGFKGLEGSRR